MAAASFVRPACLRFNQFDPRVSGVFISSNQNAGRTDEAAFGTIKHAPHIGSAHSHGHTATALRAAGSCSLRPAAT
jgi:hypothetical protein